MFSCTNSLRPNAYSTPRKQILRRRLLETTSSKTKLAKQLRQKITSLEVSALAASNKNLKRRIGRNEMTMNQMRMTIRKLKRKRRKTQKKSV